MQLQEQAMDTSRKLRLADFQIESLKRQKLMALLAEKEILALDADVNTYESVGRMFVLTPREEVKSNLKKRQGTSEDKIKDLNKSKDYLERSLKEAENNLREMVMQKRR